MREWIIGHPELVGAILAASVALTVLQIFDAGREIGAARMAASELDRIASEALGG